MAAIDFPSSPSNGDTHAVGGVTYTYNSAETKWKTTINSNAFLPLTGGTVSGNIVLGGEIQHDGDTHTNISFDADTILFDTAGSERFRVGSAGQLGIGGATYGTDGQVLTSTGASSAPAWEDIPAAFESYAVINDTKTTSDDAGTFTSGAWRTRDVNTEVDDPDGIVTIATNQFTLGAGSYLIRWSAPGYGVNMHQTRLYDVTNTAERGLGSAEFARSTDLVQNRSFGSDRVTITANTTYEIQHRCSASRSDNGLGVGQSGATLWSNPVFTIVEIYKEA